MYAEILDAVIAMANSGYLYTAITIGALPPSNGISMYIGSGAPTEIHLDRGSINSISIVANAKHQNQRTALEALSYIHAMLSRTKNYPSGDGWTITDVETAAAPNYIGEEEGGRQYLWGSILRVDFYVKGVD